MNASGLLLLLTLVQSPDGPPAGWSAEGTYNDAYRNYMENKDEAAIQEFGQYLKYATTPTENVLTAFYYVGQIYYRNTQWENAIRAFNSVMEMFPTSSKVADAQYMKACALMNNRQTTRAGREFKDFIAKHPDHSKVKESHLHLRELGLEDSRGGKD